MRNSKDKHLIEITGRLSWGCSSPDSEEEQGGGMEKEEDAFGGLADLFPIKKSCGGSRAASEVGLPNKTERTPLL